VLNRAVSIKGYTTFRDEIIRGAGAKNYDYDQSYRKAYAAADSATKHTMDAWAIIDQNLPSEAENEAVEKLKIVKDAESKQ
jgi:hypothetical protein